jgi:hypothetical protein
MKVLNLRCALGHGFEGWFGSEADFLSQQERALIACPACGDHGVVRLPAAPRLNLSGAQAPREKASDGEKNPSDGSPSANPLATTDPQGVWLDALREVYAKTENVGKRFPEEVRRIHYGEVTPRSVRGQATPAECAELQEEGISVFALPVLPELDGPKH